MQQTVRSPRDYLRYAREDGAHLARLTQLSQLARVAEAKACPQCGDQLSIRPKAVRPCCNFCGWVDFPEQHSVRA